MQDTRTHCTSHLVNGPWFCPTTIDHYLNRALVGFGPKLLKSPKARLYISISDLTIQYAPYSHYCAPGKPWFNDSPECLEVHEFGVAEERPRRSEDDQREESVVDVAVLAEVLARVGALDLEAVVRALRGREGGQLVCRFTPYPLSFLLRNVLWWGIPSLPK